MSKTRNSLTKTMSQQELADHWGMPVRTLAAWRYQGRGPAYLKLNGGTIRYRVEDVEAYESENLMGADR